MLPSNVNPLPSPNLWGNAVLSRSVAIRGRTAKEETAPTVYPSNDKEERNRPTKKQ